MFLVSSFAMFLTCLVLIPIFFIFMCTDILISLFMDQPDYTSRSYSRGRDYNQRR